MCNNKKAVTIEKSMPSNPGAMGSAQDRMICRQDWLVGVQQANLHLVGLDGIGRCRHAVMNNELRITVDRGPGFKSRRTRLDCNCIDMSSRVLGTNLDLFPTFWG